MNLTNKLKTDKDFRTLILTVISGLTLIISFLGVLKDAVPFDMAWVAIILSGYPILKGAITGLIIRCDIRAGVLVSIALVAAVAIGEYFAAGEVAFIMMIGELLESMTVRKANKGLSKLICLVPQTANILENGIERQISISHVKVGDCLLVRPGETMPVDGTIIKGTTSVDQSVITGESMPVDKSEGEEVYVGTINRYGAVEIVASKIGEDSSLGKMIRLVKEAESKKAPIVRVADRWATIIVPIVLFLSMITYLGATHFSSVFAFIGSIHATSQLSPIVRAVTILVVFCPCALVLATPTAIMAAIGNATKQGVLIKSGEAVEKMSKVNVVVLDKTGTLTLGKPQVVQVASFNASIDQTAIISLAASGEKMSEHPLGKAVVEYAHVQSIDYLVAGDFHMTIGKGISAKLKDRNIFIGSPRYIQDNNIVLSNEHVEAIIEEESLGRTVLLLADEKEPLGFISVADKIKDNAAQSVEKMKRDGISEIILLTGDNETTANAIAKRAGITQVYSSQLPSDKVEVVRRQQENGKHVVMVGDGVNDAPALATASVGVAMGAMGTDIAVEAADIAIMSDDIGKLPGTINLCKKAMKTITINIIISMSINLVAVILAGLGLMGPVVGALVHNAGSVLVVANSALLLKYRYTK